MSKITLLFVPAILFLIFSSAHAKELSYAGFHKIKAEQVLDFDKKYEVKDQYSLNRIDFTRKQAYKEDAVKPGFLKKSSASTNDSFIPYITRQNIHQPLVGMVTVDLSMRKQTRHSKSTMKELLPASVGEVIFSGVAFMTNLAVHEFGHAVVADYVGVSSNQMDFFKKEGDQFFLGTSRVEGIEKDSILPYTMGGEFFADLTFEHALQSYRSRPSGYNKALLFYSGTDFLWYSFYSFYLTGGNESFDPNNISKETGLSEDVLFSIVLAKTVLNAYRIFSGDDSVVPYFTVDKNSAVLNLAIPF